MFKKLLLSLLFVGTLLHATPATQENLTKLYIATFDRVPDADGLKYWIDSGWQLEDIAISFFDQKETQAKYPEDFSLEDFIEAIYQHIFGRGADSDGFDYWLEALQKGDTQKALFILAVMNGALGDDAKLLNNKTAVGLAFVRDGRNDIAEAHTILYKVTADVATVDSTLCSHTLAGCVEEKNTAPTADAGNDQTCAILNTPTALDGSASSDPDTGDTLTYAWSVTDSPTGSTATLTSETTATPSLTFDKEGSYTLSLVVNDGTDDSTADTVTVQTGGMTGAIDGYGLVCSPHTGKVWLDRNLGATMVCSESRADFADDAAYIASQEDCFGDYYQWGRDADGHQVSTSTTTDTQATDLTNTGTEFITSSDTYNNDWAQAADGSGTTREANWSATDGSSVCPIGYRVPTEAELAAETTGAGVTNRDDAFTSFLKLPSAGYRRFSSGSLDSQGSWGILWSASVDGSYSRVLYFDLGDADWYNDHRAVGQAVRCLRD